MKRDFLKRIQLVAILVILVTGIVNAQGFGEAAPDFTLSSSNGESFTLSEQQGKVVFINFVGYSCGICISNAPNINIEVYEKFKSHDNFVAIAIDVWDGSAEEVNYYIESSGVSFPVLALGSDVATTYNTGKHRVIVIDDKGIVQHNTNKDATASEVEDVVAILDNLFDVVASKKDVQNNSLKIFPNPAKTFVTIENEFVDGGNSELRIINSIGQEVYKEKDFKNNTIDLGGLNKGIYFIQRSSGTKVTTNKLVVEY